MNVNFSKVRNLIIFLSVFLLSACTVLNTKYLVFSGESDNWRVIYKADVIAKKNSEISGFSIQYIGNEPIPEQIEYTVFNTLGSTPLNHGVYETYGSSSCSNCAVTREDSEMEAIIKWGDSSETIQLVLE